MKTRNKTAIINGVEIYAEDDMVVRAADDYGRFEHETFGFWLDYLQPGELALDVGAYTGIYSIAASKRGCTVYSFEPNDRVFNRLNENLYMNNCTDVKVFEYALSDRNCMKYFKRKCLPLTSGGSISDTGYGIECRALDSCLNKTAKICAIKIDVEGHEYRVLLGGSQVIQRNKPLVIAEFLTEFERARITNLMKDFGYQEPFVCDKRNLIFIP